MSEKSNGKSNGEDSGEIIHFPGLEERQKHAKDKTWQSKKAHKLSRKDQKKLEQLEEEYRRQYRSEHGIKANKQANMARQSASGKSPMINWHKIPPFTRFFVGSIFIIHLVTSLALNDAQRLVLFMNHGFVPAYYSSTIPWVWSALIAPFTTALLHGGWMHILTNCVMMTAMGVFFERHMGLRKTLIFFVFSLMCGNLAFFILSPEATNPVVGASGAISGLFGAVILLMNYSGLTGPLAHKRGPLPLILIWITIMIVVGMISSDTAWQSHLGGFLGGIGLFQLLHKGKIRF